MGQDKKDVVVNIEGVSMSVESGTPFINKYLDDIKAEIIKKSGENDPTKLKLSLALLEKHGLMIRQKTPESLDDKNLDMWLQLAEENPGMPGSQVIKKLIETSEWKIFFNVEVKKPKADPEYWCSNSIRRTRGSLKL